MSKLTVYEWTAVELEWETPLGLYWIFRINGGWQANWRRSHASDDGVSKVEIETLNEEGERANWPSLETAKLACRSHHERMRHGESAHEAAVRLQVNTDRYARRVG